MSETKISDIQEILGYLPHRYPFLLVDRIIDFEEGKSIVAIKNVTVNEPHFQGHFPDAPIMPGVLILEAMAQVGGCLVFKSLQERDSKLVFLIGVDKARFRRTVRPGDQLKIVMTADRIKSRVGRLLGKAFVGEELVTSAEIMFSLVDRDDYR